ncbi:MAG: malate/lactate/ureidoglycolate dehydrogenase [Bauldia sp.]|nr:MAG: malate/lactate/ureidoglycolate dehydrogenase [Bauldia sp.]
MVTIKADRLADLVRDIFLAAGCSREEAGRIGKYLVEANLTGHDSHGVQRVPRYLQWKREGFIKADREVRIVSETPVLAVLDGQHGFGQTVAPLAVAKGIAMCKAMGLSAVTLRNAGHVGRVGDWAEMAAAEGLISIHFVNAAGSVLVAPFGAIERRFSTAPYCVGIPREGAAPIVLDFATSLVAEGKVLNASFGGKKIPDNALIAPDGTMSGDPHVLYGGFQPTGPREYRQGKGAMRAMGEHKGSGLALVVELLGGALSGTGAAQLGKTFANGMFSIYVDPKCFDTEGLFAPEVARFVGWVKEAKPIDPKEEVMVPGEPEARMKAKRLTEGVPLPDATWMAIVEAAIATGVDKKRIEGALA